MSKNRKTIRIKGYNYALDNLYFITSCVQDRVCCFGEVVNGEMILNDYGTIADKQWHWLGRQYPYVVLHAFVVMPNHVHGIIEINRDRINYKNHINRVVGTGRDPSLPRDEQQSDEQQPSNKQQPTASPKIKSLSELMGAYKTTVSKQIHLSGYDAFKWQRSFYEHIIRHEQAYKNISKYINDNPSKWETDIFYG